MITVTFQASTPEILKTKLDAIIAANPGMTFIHVVEMQSARTHFIVIHNS